jgi:Cof subfamily protein (haloacid dehalogenase superfamily)
LGTPASGGRSTAVPRLVATDLDGTLVRSDGSVSDRSVRVLRAAESAGVTVVFVTGRPPRWMVDVAERTGHTGLAICANGALVYDLRTESVVEEHALSVEVGLEVVRRLRAALPDVGFAVEQADTFAHEPVYRPRGVLPSQLRIARIEDLLDGATVKLLARHEALSADELLAAAREVVGDLAELTHSSREGLLEVSATGVSKATTLAALCEERGLAAEDVVAFGDMPNDLPMLAWAGTAYAMANAHPDVLAAVPRRAPSNDDDGVARVLERLLGLDRG